MDSLHLYCPLDIVTDYNTLALFARRQFNPPVYDLATRTLGAYLWRSTFQRRIIKYWQYGLHPFPRDFELLIRKQEAQPKTQKASKRKKQKKRKKTNVKNKKKQKKTKKTKKIKTKKNKKNK